MPDDHSNINRASSCADSGWTRQVSKIWFMLGVYLDVAAMIVLCGMPLLDLDDKVLIRVFLLVSA